MTSFAHKQMEPDFDEVVKKVQSSSRAMYKSKLLNALADAINDEHYMLACQLKDLFIKDFGHDLPDMGQFAKLRDCGNR